MAFGGILAARTGAWLVATFHQPSPRIGPVVLVALTFIVGVTVSLWGARLYHRVPTSDSRAPTS